MTPRCLILLGVCLNAALAAEPLERLVIQAPGSVTVIGDASASKVVYRGKARLQRRPGVVHLQVFQPHAEVRVPRSAGAVIVRAGEGAVSVSGVDAFVDVLAAGGPLTFDHIAGGLTARTGGGEIRLGHVGGPVICYSGGGGITASRLGAESVIETEGGEIAIGEAIGPLRITSGGGNVHVGRAVELTAVTRAGSVEVEDARGPVSARTFGGAIRLGAVSGPVEASTALGSILAGMVRASGGSAFDTRAGDITVILPSNIAVTVQAQNLLAGRIGWVVSDFPELEAVGGRWFGSRMLVARGSINGGGPLLKLSASGGVIRLLRK